MTFSIFYILQKKVFFDWQTNLKERTTFNCLKFESLNALFPTIQRGAQEKACERVAEGETDLIHCLAF